MKSIEHLNVIDQVFATENYPDKQSYLALRKAIQDLNTKAGPVSFTDELYVGGKKGAGEKGYGRQMLLSDIFEYIINGRGYLFAEKSANHRKFFLKMIFCLLNQLIIWDSLTVNSKLRKKVLHELESKIVDDFFKEDDMARAHKALMKFDGDVGFDVADSPLGKDEKRRLDDYFDSLLPKTAGGLWNELLVYIYLLRLNVGYILPLLLNQRLLSKDDSMTPPDFLFIAKEGDIFGIEVGGGKGTQSSLFQQKVRGIRMLTTENPYIPRRCPICGTWILFCDKVINDFSAIDENPLLIVKEDIRCAHDCNLFSYDDVLNGKCPFTQYRGPIDEDRKTRQKLKYDSSYYHYHFSCVLKVEDKTALRTIGKQRKRFEKHIKKHGETPKNCTHSTMKITRLKANYPYVDGLEEFEKLPKEKMVCYTQFRNDENCRLCTHIKDCRKLKEINNLLSLSKFKKPEETVKRINELFS